VKEGILKIKETIRKAINFCPLNLGMKKRPLYNEDLEKNEIFISFYLKIMIHCLLGQLKVSPI
jgi:hypothetical protein